MNRFEHALFQSVRGFVDDKQHLLAASDSHGRHESPTHRQLIAPGLRHSFAPGRSDDGGIGCALGVAEHAIAKHQVHIGQPQWAQVVARFLVQAAQRARCVHLARQRPSTAAW
jgi:hypothetical protein